MTEKVIELTMEQVEKKLLDTGIVYAINKLILHPLGMALSITTNDEGRTYLAIVQTPGGNVWSFTKEAEQAGKAKLRAFLDKAALPPRIFNRLNLLTKANYRG